MKFFEYTNGYTATPEVYIDMDGVLADFPRHRQAASRPAGGMSAHRRNYGPGFGGFEPLADDRRSRGDGAGSALGAVRHQERGVVGECARVPDSQTSRRERRGVRGNGWDGKRIHRR